MLHSHGSIQYAGGRGSGSSSAGVGATKKKKPRRKRGKRGKRGTCKPDCNDAHVEEKTKADRRRNETISDVETETGMLDSFLYASRVVGVCFCCMCVVYAEDTDEEQEFVKEAILFTVPDICHFLQDLVSSFNTATFAVAHAAMTTTDALLLTCRVCNKACSPMCFMSKDRLPLCLACGHCQRLTVLERERSSFWVVPVFNDADQYHTLLRAFKGVPPIPWEVRDLDGDSWNASPVRVKSVRFGHALTQDEYVNDRRFYDLHEGDCWDVDSYTNYIVLPKQAIRPSRITEADDGILMSWLFAILRKYSDRCVYLPCVTKGVC